MNEGNQDIQCPFCGERGFDLVGLKGHLQEFCEVFDNLENPMQQMFRKLKEQRERKP